MHTIKNPLLSMPSAWCLNQSLHKASEETVPLISAFQAAQGREALPKTPVFRMAKTVFPNVWRVPLFRRQWCSMIVEELQGMVRKDPRAPIVLRDEIPELAERVFYLSQSVLQSVLFSLMQRECKTVLSAHITQTVPGAPESWRHQGSADVVVSVPLNAGYEGGGVSFHQHGTLKSLPPGHALVWPAFPHSYRFEPVTSGRRWMLHVWLTDRG